MNKIERIVKNHCLFEVLKKAKCDFRTSFCEYQNTLRIVKIVQKKKESKFLKNRIFGVI